MVRFHVLGTTRLVDASGVEAREVLSRPKRLGVFAFLVLARPRGFHRRDELAALFWPELDQAHARGALRQALHHVRRALGAEFLLTRGDTEVSVDASRLWCDAIELETRAEAGALAEALDLYRGPLLPAFHLSGCIEAERWLDDERGRLARRAVAVASAVVRERECADDLAGATSASRRALELAPYDESIARTLIELLARTGARGEAVAVYDAFARRLTEDMELDASEETRALAHGIRASALVASGASERHPSDPEAGERASSPPLSRVPDDSPTRAGSPISLRHRRWRRVLPLAALALALVPYAAARWRERDSTNTARSRVAVMPFSVAGGPELAWLRDGLADLLSAHLDGAGELHAVDANVVLSYLESTRAEVEPARARAVASRFGAGLYVLGNAIESGSRLHASASLYDAEGTLLGRSEATVEDEAHLFDLVAELARQLVAIAPVQPRERLARVEAVGTASFPAIKAYLEAERMLRAGHFDSAVSSYGRAIAHDSTFALAYYRMAIARHMDPTPTGLADAHRRALAFADRLAPRDRMLVEAFDAFQRHDDREAERLYREVLSVHPDEVEAWVLLGEVITYYGLWRGRPIADARYAFERALALDSTHLGALMQLSWIAAMEERFDEVASIAERMLAEQPHGEFAPAARLQLALTQRDAAAERSALAEVRARESSYINWTQRWAHFSGDLEGRMRVARLLTDPSQPERFRRLGHVVSSRYLLDRGRWTEAFAELSPIKQVEPDAYLWTWSRQHLRPFAPVTPSTLETVAARVEAWRPASLEHRLGRLYTLGVIAARLRDSSTAELWAKELDARARELEAKGNERRIVALARALALGVRAWRAAETGRTEEALAYLEHFPTDQWLRRADSGGLAIDAVQSWLRAELLVRLGRDREAMQLYAPLGFLWGDAGLLAPKHLRLGEIHERLGDPARALVHYRRFVEIWHQCDPELRPLVQAVRERIARLERET